MIRCSPSASCAPMPMKWRTIRNVAVPVGSHVSATTLRKPSSCSQAANRPKELGRKECPVLHNTPFLQAVGSTIGGVLEHGGLF